MLKIITVGVAALVLAAPASAQLHRGTIEFGGFGSRTSYDKGLGMHAEARLTYALSEAARPDFRDWTAHKLAQERFAGQ